jgi:Ca2+-binding EF-hand superfamily protein
MKLFQHADIDNSGTIDEHELHELLKELMGNISLPESNIIYHEMDANNSGTITFDEYP